MNIHLFTNQSELQEYDQWIKNHPEGNVWQSVERKQYLDVLGKEVRIYVGKDDERIVCSALVMIDRTSFGLSTWEIPRGPIGEKREKLLERIVSDAKRDKCMALYFSPSRPLEIFNFQFSIFNSSRLVHCEATLQIDLTQSEEEIRKQMKQKGRYNIKVADKNEVEVRESDDIEAYYQLAKQTGERDSYTIVSKKKYETFLTDLPGAFLLLAYSNSEAGNRLPAGQAGKLEADRIPNTEYRIPTAIAGLLGVLWNKKAIYYYGASNHAYRASMAPYALQWAAIQKAKAAGCTTYDLLGVAPPEADAKHPWQGITSFKEKFGGELVSYPAEQVIVLRPMMKKLLEIKRKILQ